MVAGCTHLLFSTLSLNSDDCILLYIFLIYFHCCISDSILSSIDTGNVHSKFNEGHGSHDEEIRAAFPIMDAFKGHSLLSADDLKDKKEYYGDEDSIDRAVQLALRKLHKKKEYMDSVVNRATAEPAAHHRAKHAPKRNITAKEVVDQIVKDEIKRHGYRGDSDASDEQVNDSEEGNDVESNAFESKIHKKLAQISSLEHKLTQLVHDVKKYLKKRKAHDPSSDNVGLLEDHDDVERIMAFGSKKKRNEIPRSHISLIEKYRNNPELVDKYIDNILDSKDETTANGEQRDLLGKKETESALLRDAIPNGDLNSIPLSRLDKESEDYDNMATDRGIARDALVESPFSILDIKKTTGKKFRHGLN